MKKTITLFSCALLFGSAVGAQTVLPRIPNYVSRNGLVGWWEFSGNAGDSSGKGNHGTVKDAILTTDRFGFETSAYEFDGNGYYINVADHPTLRCRRVTMAAWIYQRSAAGNPAYQVIYKGNFADANSEAYSINTYLESGVKISSNCRAGQGWNLLSFNRQAAFNTWVHVCSTFDGDSIYNYMNGARVNSRAVSGKIDSCVGSDLRFGYNHNIYQSGNAFLGKIDDIGVWNRALSATEVEALYTGIPIPSGIEEVVATEQVLLYPNPARNAIILSRSSAGNPLEVRIMDLMGRVVIQESFSGREKTFFINSTLASGTYLVAIANTQGALIFRQKLVVE